ncbi:MAG: T9SS type A sorting domain-containing protein [Chlorobi bacterium]|nr:T9SS type A sorting domain-containing protein [Chlorobiota bacterium]
MKKLLLIIFINLLLSLNVIFAQIEENSFDFDGKTRQYSVFLPQNYQPNMPVVINLHAWGNSISKWMGYTMMNDVADTAGFIVVYPSGINQIWNGRGDISQGDDVGFISALLDTLDNKYNIDMFRIYLTGASNGAFMTYRLLGEIGHRFAAAAPVAGALSDLATNWKPSQFSPILIIHGTADQSVLYDGNGNKYWSVEETINYWIRNNNCSLQADTLLLPDIDTTDNSTIEKISWTNCSNNSSIIHYKVIDGAHHWPGGNTDFLINKDGNLNNDINSSAEMWGFFKNYKNPLANMAYAKSMEISDIYYKPESETFTINAELTNPDNHPVSVYAKIVGDKSVSKDSIELFDDGLHGDGNASDNFFSGDKQLSDLSEDMYTVKLYTNDQTTNTVNLFYLPKRFSTKGPIAFERLEITTSDTIPNPGDRIKFSLTLKNLGITDTVFNVDVKIIIMDTTILNTTTGTPKFGDIAPGESLTNTSRNFALSFRKDGDSSSVGLHEFGLKIYSNGELFWYDTFTIDVVTDMESEIFTLPKEFVLEQNYPNPFNPSTTIKYSIPKKSYVTLIVFDVLGREATTLIQKEQSQGNYEIEFDASHLTSGIYFYRIQAGEFVDVKKILLLK